MCWANKSYSDPNYLFVWPIIFLTLLFFGYIFSVSYVSLRESGILQDAMEKESPFVAEVLLSGVIQSAGGCAISANCSSLLRLTLSFLLLKKPNNPLIIIFLTKKYLFY
jgi:hypothetical protein